MMKSQQCFPYVLLVLAFYLTTAFGQDASVFLAKGDSAYDAFDNESARKNYSKVMELDENNYQAAWKLARAYTDIGEILTDKNQRNMHYRKADSYARKAVEIDSNGAKAHLFLSIAIGRVALDAGKKEQVRLSKEMHVLGRWNRKMATLGWLQRKFANWFLGGVPKDASVDSAKVCFQRAIELHPEHINHHLELALTYEELKMKQEAIAEYQKVIEMPKMDADDDKYKEQAAERLKKLQ
jgi:tetratricopeptide (TPR) repeat protein